MPAEPVLFEFEATNGLEDDELNDSESFFFIASAVGNSKMLWFTIGFRIRFSRSGASSNAAAKAYSINLKYSKKWMKRIRY